MAEPINTIPIDGTNNNERPNNINSNNKDNTRVIILQPFHQRGVAPYGPCSCCNLTTQQGTKYIAYVGIVFGFLNILLGVLYIVLYDKISEDIANSVKKRKNEDIDLMELDKAVTVFGIITVILGAVDILDSICLFIGALKEIRFLCIISIVGKFVELFLNVAALIAPIIISTGMETSVAPHFFGLTFLHAYFIYVVFWYIKELKFKALGGQEVVRMYPTPSSENQYYKTEAVVPVTTTTANDSNTNSPQGQGGQIQDGEIQAENKV